MQCHSTTLHPHTYLIVSHSHTQHAESLNHITPTYQIVSLSHTHQFHFAQVDTLNSVTPSHTICTVDYRMIAQNGELQIA